MNYTKSSYLAMICSDKKRETFSERDHTNLEENHGKRNQYKCLHLEEEEGCCNNYGSISFPIYQTATYEHPAVGQSTGFDYSRLQNPTREHLEKIVATLENGNRCTGFSTGMAAITLVMELFKPGDHLIIDADLYGGSIRLFDNVSSKTGSIF